MILLITKAQLPGSSCPRRHAPTEWGKEKMEKMEKKMEKMEKKMKTFRI